jgi:HPt (histidine-containing phosphotransfer) domain-containing protein
VRLLNGNVASYCRLLRLYAESYGETIGDLRRQLRAGERAEVQRYAHALKGVSANLRVTGVQQAAVSLEAALGSGNATAEELDALAVQLAARYATICSALITALEPPPEAAGTPPAEVDWAGARRLLGEIEALLAGSHLRAINWSMRTPRYCTVRSAILVPSSNDRSASSVIPRPWRSCNAPAASTRNSRPDTRATDQAFAPIVGKLPAHSG